MPSSRTAIWVEVLALPDDHLAADGLAAGQELGLAQDRRAATTGLATLPPALPLGLHPGRAFDPGDLVVGLLGPRRGSRTRTTTSVGSSGAVPASSPRRRRRRRRALRVALPVLVVSPSVAAVVSVVASTRRTRGRVGRAPVRLGLPGRVAVGGVLATRTAAATAAPATATTTVAVATVVVAGLGLRVTGASGASVVSSVSSDSLCPRSRLTRVRGLVGGLTVAGSRRSDPPPRRRVTTSSIGGSTATASWAPRAVQPARSVEVGTS